MAAILNLIIPEDAPEGDDIELNPSFQDSQLETGMPSLGKDAEKGRETDADAEYKARVEPAPESSRGYYRWIIRGGLFSLNCKTV